MAKEYRKSPCACICGTLLVCLLLCSLACAAPALPSMTAAAQDGAGTVWALPDSNYGNNQSEDGVVYCWQAGNWVKQVLPEAAGFSAAALAHGDDGSVYALWQKRDPSWSPGQVHTAPVPCLITVHRGTRSRISSQFTAALPTAQTPFSGPLTLYAGKGGDAWIVGDAPALLHVAPGGTVQSFPVTPDQVFGGRFQFGPPLQPLGSSVDPLGRRWFWQANPSFWQIGTLRGFLIWDGRKLAYHATLPGLPDRLCSVIVPHGGRFLWAGQGTGNYPFGFPTALKLPGSGFYKIDTRTLTAAPAALPPKASPQVKFLQAERIFWIQGDLCVLEAGYTSNSNRSVSLWRQRGTLWHKEPDTLAWSQFPSEGYGPDGWTPRPALDTAAGTWLGINGAGLEWLPADGKNAIPVNWRRGVTASRVSALFRLPDGRIMPFPCADAGALLLPQPPPLLPPRPNITLETPGQPDGIGDMLADQDRRLWGFSYQPSGRQVLQEWDGNRWQTHLLPPFKSSSQSGTLYASDTRGRIWITVTLWNPPAQSVDTRFVYDPAHDAWTQYATVPEALAAAAAEPGMAFLPSRDTSSLPVFSGSGQVVYTDNYSVFFYDGAKWRQWKSRDIQPGYVYGNAPDNPRFDTDGHLQVALADHLYGWTPADGWQPQGFAPPASPPLPSVPPGGPPGFWGQPVRDNTGGGWVALGGDVYLTRGGLWRRLAPLSGLGSPFYDRRSLQHVLQDTKGRFFFETTPGGFYEYVVWSPLDVPLSAPHIQIRPLSADSVLLRFGPAIKGAHAPEGPREFQWRLDGGDWKTPKLGSTVLLTALRPGTYRVEAQALSPLLQVSPTPSAAVFIVQPPTAAQIAAWVQVLLTGPDAAREAAVAGLVKQPAAALPVLQAARPAASDAGRWWIDAVIQQMQAQDERPNPHPLP